MDKKVINKIITVSFVFLAFLSAIVLNVLLKTLAASWGPMARIYDHDFVRHGVPVLFGIIIFGLLQFNKKTLLWADESVTEVSKVVWPSKKDTSAMTTVVCVMLAISGIILFLFDMLSTGFVKLIVN